MPEFQQGQSLQDIAGEFTAFQRSMAVLGVSLAVALDFGTTLALLVLRPEIAGTVGGSAEQMLWINVVYLAAMLPVVPLTGRLLYRFGDRNLLTWAVLLYAAGSAGCGFSHSLGMLVASLTLMGSVAGLFFLRADAILYRLFPRKLSAERAKNFRLYSAVIWSLRALAPLMAGHIVDTFGWRPAFFINVPIALIAVILIRMYIPKRAYRRDPQPKIDWIGMICLLVGVGSLEVVLGRGEQYNWFTSDLIYWLTVVGLLSLGIFTWWELWSGHSHPAVNLRLIWRDPTLLRSLPVVLVLGVVFSNGLYALPEYLRNLETHSPGQEGNFFAANGAALGVGALVCSFSLQYIERRIFIVLGFVIAAGAMAWLYTVVTVDTPDVTLYRPLLLEGFGLGFSQVGYIFLLMGERRFSLINDTMYIYVWFRRIGQALGAAAVTVLVDWRWTLHSSRLNESLYGSNNLLIEALHRLQATLSHSGLAGVSSLASLQALMQISRRQSAALAFGDTFLFMGFLCIAAIPCVALLPPSSRGSEADPIQSLLSGG